MTTETSTQIEPVNSKTFPIPGTLNLVIAFTSWTSFAALLYFFQHTHGFWIKAAIVVVLSFVGNTIFSLLHESVHRVAHRRTGVNEFIGLISGAFFPTSLAFQRICHLGHHRRNRTDAEMFDLRYAKDNLPLKCVQLYGILTGLYWPLPPLGCALFFVSPSLLAPQWLQKSKAHQLKHTGASAMLGIFTAPSTPKWRIRAEILFVIAFQLGLCRLLGLSFATWIICYYFFGLNWAALQYADHAGSVRDIREGAWNLKVNWIVEKLFLNYHYHLVHHRHPGLPWIHLPKFVKSQEPWPTFWEKYFLLWRGPRITTEPPPRDIDPDFAWMIDTSGIMGKNETSGIMGKNETSGIMGKNDTSGIMGKNETSGLTGKNAGATNTFTPSSETTGK